jgi:hypothetical protein
MRKPGPAPITLTLSPSGLYGSLYAEDVQVTYLTEDFNRVEWLHSKLQTAMDETNFAKPIIVTTAVNAPLQVGISPCGFDSAVPLGPESFDNLQHVLSRFNITRYTITGAPSSPTIMQELLPIANEHARRLDYFKAYLARVQDNISYQDLIAFQSEAFSYLTSTGLAAAGLDINESNCLITSLTEGTIHYIPSTQTARTVGWSCTLEVRTLSSRLTY